MRNREIREARINDAATKIRVFFLSFLLETVFVEPARTRYTKVSTNGPHRAKRILFLAEFTGVWKRFQEKERSEEVIGPT